MRIEPGQVGRVAALGERVRLHRRVHAAHAAHDKALKGGLVGLKAAEPFACARHALNRGVDCRVAVGGERRLTLAGRAESAAVRTALHANFVPQVVVGERIGSHSPGARHVDAQATRVARARRKADVAGDNESLVTVARLRYHERAAASAVASAKPQVARGVPVRVKVLVAAGKARHAAIGHKDAVCQLGKLGAQVVQSLVKVLEQIAQEQVEVHARELLAHHGRRRAVAHRATERRRVAVVDKALLKPNANLRKHVAHAVGVGIEQQRARPHLARQARQRVDLFGQGAGAHQQVRTHAVHVGLRHDLGRKAQKAQLAGEQVVEFLGRMLARGQLLEQTAEQRHVGQVLKCDAAQVEVLHGVGQTVGGDAVAQAGDGRGRVHDQRRLGARLANVGYAEARQRGLVLGRVLGLLRGTQYGRALDHVGQLGIGHGVALGSQFGGFGTLRTLGSVYRNQLDQRHVVVLQYELAQQVLKIAAVQLAAQLLVHRAVLERQRRSVVIVEPRAQRIARNGHAVGDTVVALAQVVFVAADDGFQALARNAVLTQVAAGVLEHAAQLARHAGLRVLQHDELVGLQAFGRGVAHHVAAQAGGQNGLLNRCFVGAQQCLEQDIRRDRALAVERAAQHQAQAHQGVLGRGGHLDALILAGYRRLHVQRIGRQRGRILAGGSQHSTATDSARPKMPARGLHLGRRRALYKSWKDCSGARAYPGTARR